MVKTSGFRRWWLAFAILAAVILAAAFCFDAAVQGWVAEYQTQAGVKFMRGVSKCGDWPSHVIIGIAGAAIAYSMGRREWLMIFAAMVIACVVTGSASRVIKIAAGRSRPSVKVDVGWNGPSLKSNYHAFPSGHTASSTAFFTTLCLARRKMGFALLPIPLLIAFSRIYLNAHHLSDVVFAAILGIVCAVLVRRLVARRFERHREPEEID